MSNRARVDGIWRWAWLLGALAALGVYPALVWNSGAVAYDAALQHIYRGFIFSDAISDGALYPRWVQFLHLGLGSPLFTFQAPLPYYALDLLYRLGLSHPLGWRVLIAGGLLAACMGTYLLVYALTSLRWSSVLAAIAYLFAPYVLRNSLERGSNEAFSMFLYPWVLWALLWLARRPRFGRFLVAMLLWAACIASHVLGPLMLGPVALGFGVWASWRYRTALPILALLAGGLLTAFIWAPMSSEQAAVHVERDFDHPDAQPWDNPIPLADLLAAPVVYDVARENNLSGNRVGLLHTGLLLLGLPAAAWAYKQRRRELAFILLASSLIGLGLLWSFTDSASNTWRLLAPLVGRLQYRSRLMGLQALMAAVVAGLLIVVLSSRWRARVAVCLIALFILAALPSLYINLRHHYAPFVSEITWDEIRDTEIKLGGSALTAYSEFTPRWRTDPFDAALLADLGTRFDAQAKPLSHPPVGVSVKKSQVRSSAWNLLIEAANPVTLTLNLLYYPRWQAFLDNEPVALSPQAATGYAQLAFPAGSHRLRLQYGTTLAERAGFVISALTLAGVLIAGVVSLLRARRRRSVGVTETSEAGAHPTAMPLPAPAIERAPPLWLLIGLTVLVLFKAFYIDGVTLWLRCQSTPDRVCGASVTTDIPFAGGMRLRGFSAPTEVQRGEEIVVRLFSQADHPIDRGLSTFIHIRNSEPGWPMNPETGDDIWAQKEVDGPGGFFTTGYLPGRIYDDEQRLRIPEEMPPGEYYLEIGWFDPSTGEQLEPDPASIKPPLRILWRSVLLPSVHVR